MDGFSLFQFTLWKLLDLFKEFIIFYIAILLGEWFVQKRRYNLFERAWVITTIVLGILTFVLWRTLGKLLIFI